MIFIRFTRQKIWENTERGDYTAACTIIYSVLESSYLTRFNKIAIQGAPQMVVDKEAISISRVYSYYSKCNLPLFYV